MARPRCWTDEEPDRPEPGAFVSLRVLTAAAGRHWRLLSAAALVGLVIGAGFHLVVPRKYASTTDLFLTEPAASDPAQAMANDTSLLQTRAVAKRAVAALHLHSTPDSFLASYQGFGTQQRDLVDHFQRPLLKRCGVRRRMPSPERFSVSEPTSSTSRRKWWYAVFRRR